MSSVLSSSVGSSPYSLARLLLVPVLGLAVLIASGCGSRDSAPQKLTVQGEQLPLWVSDPFMEGHFGAVGSSRKSLGGMQEQMDRAMAAARTELARTIQSRVQSSYVRFFSESGEASWGEDGNPELQTLAQEMSENVSRQLTNQVLQGSRRKNIYQHGPTGELYVWVIIDPEQMAIVNQQVKAQASKELAARAQVKAELKAKEALERLDKAIDDEMARQAGGE